jgi:hypothetical protein
VLTTAAVETLHFTIFSAMSIALTQLFVFTVSWPRVDRKVICSMYSMFQPQLIPRSYESEQELRKNRTSVQGTLEEGRGQFKLTHTKLNQRI